MTEAEAKTKWCPFARTLGWNIDSVRHGEEPQFVFGSENREVGPYDADGEETVRIAGRHRCIASACMAWRWVPKAAASPGGDPNYYPGPWKGFCGLAGKP